jgi:hypothetical protein
MALALLVPMRRQERPELVLKLAGCAENRQIIGPNQPLPRADPAGCKLVLVQGFADLLESILDYDIFGTHHVVASLARGEQRSVRIEVVESDYE